MTVVCGPDGNSSTARRPFATTSTCGCAIAVSSSRFRREGWHARSPAVLLAGDYFLSAWFDWYVSDASMIYNLAPSPQEETGFDGVGDGGL